MTTPRDRPAAVRLALSPVAAVAAVAGGLALLGTLVAVLASLESTRSEIKATRADIGAVAGRVQRIDRRLDPLLDDASALEGTVRRPALLDGLRSASRAARTVPGLADDTALLLDELQRSGLATALPQLAEALPRAAAALRPILRVVPDLGPALRTVPRLVAQLRDQRRLTARSIRIQTTTATLNRRTLALLTDSLGVQRELLVRTRSLDTKVPAAGALLP